MNIIDKVSEALQNSVDFIIDKNRQLAQLHRLEAIIRTETEIINNAYIALGKIYQKKLEGNPDETSAELLLETIKNSKLRLKKARARYEYTAKYGVPKPCCCAGSDCSAAADADEEPEETAEPKEPEIILDEDEEDITIAYAAPENEITPVAKAETAAELEANAPIEEKAAPEKKSDTAADLKKKRGSRKKAVVRESDSEAANENDTKPLV